MALTMKDKAAQHTDTAPWPQWLMDEFRREAERLNGCVGSQLLSETETVRVWTIRLKPGERVGFHRHVLDYFWTTVTAGRGRQHLHDGTTVECTYRAGETRHETCGAGDFKVRDLESIGDTDMVFMTVELLASANAPLPVPETVRAAQCAA